MLPAVGAEAGNGTARERGHPRSVPHRHGPLQENELIVRKHREAYVSSPGNVPEERSLRSSALPTI